eukprot:GDKI01037469.1.p2 GENE.GDKI01037469.1~~GDKI01037469.1.p2  ORF type:complete len:174 (-),score=28.81 GDKI01037469.1:117-638(-)
MMSERMTSVLPPASDVMKQMMTKREELREKMRKIDKEVYRTEDEYLKSTIGSTGNALRGWDMSLQQAPAKSKTKQPVQHRSAVITSIRIDERKFSLASLQNPIYEKHPGLVPESIRRFDEAAKKAAEAHTGGGGLAPMDLDKKGEPSPSGADRSAGAASEKKRKQGQSSSRNR